MSVPVFKDEDLIARPESIRKLITTDWYFRKKTFRHKGLEIAEYLAMASKFGPIDKPPTGDVKVLWVRDDVLEAPTKNGIQYPFIHSDIPHGDEDLIRAARKDMLKLFEEFYAKDIAESGDTTSNIPLPRDS